MVTSTENHPNLYALLVELLAARDDALGVGFLIRVDESGIDAWPGVGEHTERASVPVERAEQIAARWQRAAETYKEALTALANDAHTLAELRANVPTTYAEALIAWHFVQREYEEALHTHAKAATQRSLLEDEMGRVRRECGRKIQEAHLAANPGAKPIADTPLNAQAGDHPDYVEHRRKIEDALERERAWDARVKVMAGRVDIARVVAEGYQRLGGATVVVEQRERVSALGHEVLREAQRTAERQRRSTPAQDTPIYRDPPTRDTGPADSAR